MKNISLKSIIVWRIRFILLFIVFEFILGGIGILNVQLSVVLVVLCIILGVIIIIPYCSLRYSSTLYLIKEKRITIRQNVIFSRIYSININKIQYIEIVQSPIQRLFKLCSLILHTAGSKVRLEQLPIKEGIKIKKYYL